MPPSTTREAVQTGRVVFTTPERELQFEEMVRACVSRDGKPIDPFSAWFEFRAGETTPDERLFSIHYVLRIAPLLDGKIQVCYEGYISRVGLEDRYLYTGCLQGPINDPSDWSFEFTIA